jgi:phosphoenolpyruvate---glycerone phosphotransferase subunit DhaL
LGATESTVAAVRAMAAAMRENREHLTQLDAAIGDADHGTNMNRGFEAALERLDGPDSPADVLKAVSMALISKVGGASGPLYGTAFLRSASELGEGAEGVKPPEAAAAVEAALAGVKQRGKAEPGEKTMVDALDPASRAARVAADGGGSVPEVLRAAADAAREGAVATTPMVATKGRASYLCERSAGHVDPGATSTHLLLEAAASSLEEG